MLQPDWYHACVDTLTPTLLAQHDVRGVLVDLDNTIVPRDSDEIPQASRSWLSALRAADIGVCLLSNNWHQRVTDIAAEIDCPAVAKALKPFPFGYRSACRQLGLEPSSVAVVGDQVFTDVLGGNAVGATTVLITPLPGSDPAHTVLLRRLEAAIMAGRTPVSASVPDEPKGPTA